MFDNLLAKQIVFSGRTSLTDLSMKTTGNQLGLHKIGLLRE